MINNKMATAKEELKKDLNKLLNPKEKESTNDYLNRMEKEFDYFNDDLKKLLKNL